MASAEKILIDIADAAQRVLNAVSCTSDKKDKNFNLSRMRLGGQLQRIIAASQTILKENLDRSSGLHSTQDILDDRLTDWLASDDPRKCLVSLNAMEKVVKPSQSPQTFRNPVFRSAPTEDKVNDALTILDKRKDCFHFLLTTDVWNRETIIRDQPKGDEPVKGVRLGAREHGQARTSVGTSATRDGPLPQPRQSKKEVDPKQLDDVLQWLGAWNCRPKHEDTLELRQPDTCQWLPGKPAYEAWRENDNSFLWLNGKPGSGKSVLAASVIDVLERTLRDGEQLAYFYCDFRSERSTNSAEVMRSLLTQLLRSFRDGTMDPGDVLDDIIKEKERAGSLLKNAKRLALLISSAAKQFPQQPLIVVDALDECNDIENLLDALMVLNQGGLRLFLTSRPLQVIKDSFTGLPSISLERMLRAVSADMELHVTRVVDSHRRLRIASDDLKQEVRSTLLEKADGMFRWIQCQLDNLKQCVTGVQLRETLKNLPAGLEETYERILRAVDKDERGASVAQRALVWLIAALKPLRLSQLLEALSIDLGGRTLNPDLGPIHGPALLDALSSLVTYNNRTDIVILSHFSVKEYLLGNFKHPSPRYRVDLQDAHGELARCCMCYLAANLRRVREFGRGVDHVISRRVMQSGDAGVFHAPSHGKAATMAPESLLEYVISDGFRHLAHVRPRDKAALDAIRALSFDVQQYPLKWNRLRKRAPFRSIWHDHSWPSLQADFVLYILITFAPEPLLRLHLGRGPLKAREGTNPLVYAAYFGQIEHARTLLSRGANLNCTDRSSQVLPLHAAARQGRIDLVNLFLSEGSHVPEQLFSELLPMCYHDFAPPIVARLLQTDQFVEWASQQQDEALLSVFQVDRSLLYGKLTEEAFVVMKRRLMQVNCDLSSHGGFMEKLLRQAVAAGHISIAKHIHSLHDSLPSNILLHVSHSGDTSAAMIRFLIAHGANVSCSTANEATVLHFAIGPGSSQGEEECMQKIRVLIDAGCNPSAQTLSRETPLHLAAARGYISVIKYLLLLGVSVPSNIMLAASQSGCPAMLHFLISKGADVNVFAVDGNTPLHILLDSTGTASAECLECAEILFGAGLDPSYTRNSIGETPLDIAAKCGNVSVVAHFIAGNQPPPPNLLFSALFSRDPIPVIQLLLTQRVDVSAIDFSGNNAIHRTLAQSGPEDQCLEIVEVLVSAGCDPCIPNFAGQTPFHFATGKGYPLVMEYLLSLGAQLPADIIPYLLDHIPWSWPDYKRTTIQFLAEKGVSMHVVAENGDTLLHRCIAQFLEPELLDVAQILVGAGCSPSATDANLKTPLHIASRYGHIAVLDYLLSLEVPLPSDILLAAVQGSEIALVTSFLLREGADPKAVTPSGDTVLHLALRMGGMEDDRLETAKILISAGCDINARNSAGETLIHAAVRGGHLTILEYLLAKGLLFPPDILLTAASSRAPDRTPLIRFLIDQGADAHVIAPDGNSPLHLVMSSLGKNDLEIVMVLINSGCDPSLRNMDGETPLHLAASHDNAPVFKYLASLQGTLPPEDHTTRTGDTLLHLALPSRGLEGRLEILEFLINRGYDPLVRNLAGKSPIHIAVKGGDFFVVKYLLSQQVPLPSDILLAAVSGYMHDRNPIIPMINLLIREGADPGVIAADGDTPLHAILAHNFRDVDGKPVGFLWEAVEMLLNSGCDPYARNNDGRTAFDLAEAKGLSFLKNFVRLANSTGT